MNRLIFCSLSLAGKIQKTLISEKDVGPYIVRKEIWHMGGQDTEMESAYGKDGSYIGNADYANRLYTKYGIVPERSSEHHNVSSIGKSAKDGKWYGWSHRAIFGFEPGSTCKEGDSHYTPEKGEWVAQTDEDAKQMAKDFAESVSSFASESNQAMPLPSAFNIGDPVFVTLNGDTMLPAVVIAITFMASKVLYSVAIYTKERSNEFSDEYGLINSIGYDKDGCEFVRLTNLDSTFIKPYKIGCRCLTQITGENCTADKCCRRASDDDFFRELALKNVRRSLLM